MSALNRKTLLICSIPRSGTSLFCSYLTQTGLASQPGEWLGKSNELAWKRREGLSPEMPVVDYLRALQEQKRSENGVFSLKVMWFHLIPFLKRVRDENPHWAACPDRELFETILGPCHFIHIVRADTVAFGVSLYLARLTHRWRSFGSLESYIHPPVAYAHQPIRQLIDSNCQSRWPRFFQKNRIAPLELTFEEITRGEPDALVRKVFSYAEITAPQKPFAFRGKMTTGKTGGSLTSKWKARFLEDERLARVPLGAVPSASLRSGKHHQIDLSFPNDNLTARTGQPLGIEVVLLNQSGETWRHRFMPETGYHWPKLLFTWKRAGQPAVEAPPVALEQALPENRRVFHACILNAPQEAEEWILEADLLAMDGKPCSTHTGKTASIPVRVHDPMAEAAAFFRVPLGKGRILRVPWLGDLEVHWFPWVRHPQLEWMQCRQGPDGSLRFFIPDVGLVETGADRFPSFTIPSTNDEVRFEGLHYDHKVFRFPEKDTSFSTPLTGLDLPCKLKPALPPS